MTDSNANARRQKVSDLMQLDPNTIATACVEAEEQLAKIKEILAKANTRTMAADRLYAEYPELDNTHATKRARELNRLEER